MKDSSYDVAILGGGLAGASLARQLSLEAPQLRVAIIEKRKHPVREAAHKVGESSVEIGAHYFEHVLDLGPHLASRQLPKLGLRYFFTHEGNRDLTNRFELGPAAFPPVPSFQLDRGRFENFLLETVRRDADVFDGCSVKTIDLRNERHHVTVATPDGAHQIDARWIVDASGRAGLLKRKLGLARRTTHGANASWWRVPLRVKVDDWSSDPAWQARVPTRERWLSTNHLMGVGYWVWLIPLGNGSTSLGIVADGDLHPFNRINRFDRAMDWLREFEPQCAAVMEPHANTLEDFLALQHYAHDCARVFSPDRWALVGEAGVFSDPFYSPGSDFIGIANDCTTDLLIRSHAGEDVSARAESFNTTYLRLYEAFMRLYDGQYPIMGNAQVMTAKVSWDNACYWSIPALLFFQRRLRRPEFMETIDLLMRRFFVLHARMQQMLRAWDRLDRGSVYEPESASVVDVPYLREIQSSLDARATDDESLRRRLERNLSQLEGFARSWQAVALERHPSLGRFISEESGFTLIDLSPLRLTQVHSIVSSSRNRGAMVQSNARNTTAESLPPKPSDVDTATRTRSSLA
jgi:flavin-dependent dehydrogenase